MDATILALAGLKRLDQADRATVVLETEIMMPAVGQGAIAVEVRAADEAVGALVSAIDHAPSRARVEAERGFLAALDGSCHTPIAALAILEDEPEARADALHLRGLAALPDGGRVHRIERRGDPGQAEALGRAAGLALREMAGPEFFAAFDGS